MRSAPQLPAMIALAALALPAAGAAPDVQARIDLGRSIYLDGRNARGEPIRALLGRGTALTGAAAACGNCHGADGRGRPEGGVLPADITWEDLTKPYGHRRPGGRQHGPYDERTYARAVSEGLDPAGQRIDGAMPRYSLSVTEMAALTEYARQLSQQRDPGIGDAVLRLGTILPDRGPAAGAAAAIRAVLRAYVDDANGKGGIHGRRIELAIAASLAEAEERFAREPVFTLVSPYGVGSEEALARFAAARRLSVIAPFTLATVADAPPQMFFLYAGAADLARVLIDYAARGADMKTLRMAAFVGGSDATVAAALRAECKARQCAAFEVLPSSAAAEPGAVARLAYLGMQAVVFAGSDRELAALLGFAERLGWRPAIYTPDPGAARAMLAAPAAFEGRLFAAYPTRGGLQSAGAGEFERLRALHGLGEAHAAAQGFAYAAMSIALEGLRLAGRDVSRERFARAVEGLHRFDAGPTPPVSFGPGRRVGALGGFVLAVDPQGGFRPVSGWIGLDPL